MMAMRTAWTALLWSFSFFALNILHGCSSAPAVDAQSPMGGVTLELRVRDVGGLHAAYLVHEDGTLMFAGGQDARWDRPTWTGSMTAEQIDQLIDLLEAHGWFDRSPTSTSDPPERRYEATLRSPRGERRYKVSGASPQVEPVHELLKQIAAARLDPFLDQQPKAGSQIRGR